MDDSDGQRLGLAPINLTNKAAFDTAFSRLAQPLSDYTFACNYIWGTSLNLYWLRSDHHLCVFANGTGDLTLLLPPIPEPGASDGDLRDCLGRCFEVMDGYNDRCADRSHSRIEYVSDEMLERINAALVHGGPNLGAAPMSGDYVYAMERMIDLAGGGLKSKRHARSKFIRDFPDHHTEPLTERHQQACMELLGRWHAHGDRTHEGEINEERVGSAVLRYRDSMACQRALDCHAELGLKGMVLLVGEKLVGFTLGEAVSPTQASILVEKTDPGYHGLPQFIFSEFCGQHWPAYPECNAGDDWGLPSLRFTKQSYRPVRLLNKYVLSRQAVPAATGYRDSGAAAGVTVGTQGHTGTSDSNEGAATVAREAGFFIRAVTGGDLQAILDIERRSFAFEGERFNRRQVRSLMRNPRATVLAAEFEGRVVAWASTLVRSDRAGKVGRLYSLAVLPEMRGRGFGRKLAERAIASLDGHAPRVVVLEVRKDNQAAMRLYQELGFAGRELLTDYYAPGVHGYRMSRQTEQETLFSQAAGARA